MNHGRVSGNVPAPVRVLYARLCQLEENGAEKLHNNLAAEHQDYRDMRGAPEPRFYEWAHTRLEARSFITGITASALRMSDVRTLAVECGVSRADLEALGKESLARTALNVLGVREPSHPRELQDGVPTLRNAKKSLMDTLSAARVKGDGSESLARRGAERFLASLAMFLWDAGYSEQLRAVVRDGKNGFKVNPAIAKSMAHGDEKFMEWLLMPGGADLGAMNHLLRSVASEMGPQQPGFLCHGTPVWHTDCFHAFDALAKAVQSIAHDHNKALNYPDNTSIRSTILEAVSGVLELLDRRGVIWRPRAVKFFRRIEDGHGTHYEGYDDTNTRRTFFECAQTYSLHETYVYVAATNPQAIDAACIPLRENFLNPVAFDAQE